MTGAGPVPPASSPGYAVTSADLSPDLDELALVAAGFPAFCFWRENTYHGTRYAARARSLTAHPHTVITDNLAELRATLTTSQQAPQQ
jgi:hypothetical protein